MLDKARLEEFNHWWTKQKVDPELALWFKREIYSEIKASLGNRFILALVGLRRVGKTTLMYQLIQQLLEEGVPAEKIAFFSFDDSSATIQEVMRTYQEIQHTSLRDERVYFFFDEIQKHAQWEHELKKYYDLYPKIKCVISGSESLFIQKKTKESLAGRMFEFKVNPCNFKEYCALQKSNTAYESAIHPLFHSFIERGGFPETFFLSERECKEYIRSIVVDKIIYKDIPRLFSLDDPPFLGVLLELIANNPGMFLDYQSLAEKFGKDRRVIKNYIFYLEASFLIKILGNYRKSKSATLRKKKRVYPADNALIYGYKSHIDESFFGKMVETAVINSLSASAFWKNGDEIDIIHKDVPIEVKYQEQIISQDWKALRAFMRKFEQRESILITKRNEKELTVPEGKISLVPAWKVLMGNFR